MLGDPGRENRVNTRRYPLIQPYSKNQSEILFTREKNNCKGYPHFSAALPEITGVVALKKFIQCPHTCH
jgi:hypothetical protein